MQRKTILTALMVAMFIVAMFPAAMVSAQDSGPAGPEYVFLTEATPVPATYYDDAQAYEICWKIENTSPDHEWINRVEIAYPGGVDPWVVNRVWDMPGGVAPDEVELGAHNWDSWAAGNVGYWLNDDGPPVDDESGEFWNQSYHWFCTEVTIPQGTVIVGASVPVNITVEGDHYRNASQPHIVTLTEQLTRVAPDVTVGPDDQYIYACPTTYDAVAQTPDWREYRVTVCNYTDPLNNVDPGNSDWFDLTCDSTWFPCEPAGAWVNEGECLDVFMNFEPACVMASYKTEFMITATGAGDSDSTKITLEIAESVWETSQDYEANPWHLTDAYNDPWGEDHNPGDPFLHNSVLDSMPHLRVDPAVGYYDGAALPLEVFDPAGGTMMVAAAKWIIVAGGYDFRNDVWRGDALPPTYPGLGPYIRDHLNGMTSCVTEVDVYDVANDVWYTLANGTDLGAGAHGPCMGGDGVVLGNWFYVVGDGIWDSDSALGGLDYGEDRMFALDLTTSAWSVSGILGVPIDAWHDVVKVGNSLYYFSSWAGPQAGFLTADYFYRYDPPVGGGVGGAFTKLANVPNKAIHRASWTWDGYIYTAGGVDDSGAVTAKAYRYSIATDTWSDAAMADLPEGRAGSADAYKDNRFYLAGGLNPTLHPTNTFWVYDRVANTWTPLPDMPLATYRFEAEWAAGGFYTFGGMDPHSNILADPRVTQSDIAGFHERGVDWVQAWRMCADCEDTRPDLGDAPDSTNHVDQLADGGWMTAYPKWGPRVPGYSIDAHYPTVYDAAVTAPGSALRSDREIGPRHVNPKLDAYLGQTVSGEDEADRIVDFYGPGSDSFDSDFYYNIEPQGNPGDALNGFAALVEGAWFMGTRATAPYWYQFPYTDFSDLDNVPPAVENYDTIFSGETLRVNSDDTFEFIPSGHPSPIGVPKVAENGDLRYCQMSNVAFSVSCPAQGCGPGGGNPWATTRYVNIAFDWNRDGDFEDAVACSGGNNQTAVEWAVQDQQIANLGQGTWTIESLPFTAYHPDYSVADKYTYPLWMRVTVTDLPMSWFGAAPWVGQGANDPRYHGFADPVNNTYWRYCQPGQQPAAPADATFHPGGFCFGETEDYYLRYKAPNFVITKTASLDYAADGNLITYDITVTNTCPPLPNPNDPLQPFDCDPANLVDAKGVIVHDPIPLGSDCYLPGNNCYANAGGTYNPLLDQVEWTIDELKVGESVTLSFKVIVDVYRRFAEPLDPTDPDLDLCDGVDSIDMINTAILGYGPVEDAAGNLIGYVDVEIANAHTTVYCEEVLYDLGDAPDSTNHGVAGVVDTPMDAYDGVMAYFPTVYNPNPPNPFVLGTIGPRHSFVRFDAWLGPNASLELDADSGFAGNADEDYWDGPAYDVPVDNGCQAETDVRGAMPGDAFNLNPGMADNYPISARANANMDCFDDGLHEPLSLPHCETGSIEYNITVIGPQHVRYVNAWFDWNRDGDWADVIDCGSGNFVAPEWAVNNDIIDVGPGSYTFNSGNPIRSAHFLDPLNPPPMWARVTLTDVPLTAPFNNGSGPIGGYDMGETEDYYLIHGGNSKFYFKAIPTAVEMSTFAASSNSGAPVVALGWQWAAAAGTLALAAAGWVTRRRR